MAGVIAHRQQHINGKVQLAGGQLGFHIPPGHPLADDFHFRIRLQPVHKLGQEGGLQHIPQTERVGFTLCGRVKGVELVHRTLDLVQPRAHRLQKPPSQRRGHHLVTLAGKQRIVEVIPQPGQGMADGGLGQVQGLGGTGQAALPVDGVENV